ncbi:hypothetical protein PRUPE_1G344100 [Prunus persica]|uniref:Uncharacterized protein n=1 Tax=Prunus persica TaxID=3760 RepID=M5XV12_PRUPE|nr:uncharacterized protein LOC18788900 [Prunus persica]ONI32003.1 hypothetical protein PRUPE_1G344100 [Prunus persica]ONI32004.1 hypothetical protein PRUPE_1G344100 [Prunus persica]ONI32005.1 hypothetical protein PRUPE_1G344100 [Prunus persica]ONI32006.1 hypothetical protein PRUPE_1G344100 [Prunus persica]ONI32007.1 hypothetical protein PRUPE_1G344100 [Prunus persica]
MVGVAPESDDGSRRRLPQWMLGISSAGQVRKPSNGKEEGPASYETETLGENSHVLVKCETKRRKKKSTEQEEKCSGLGRRKVQESGAPERQKAKETLGENSHVLVKCEAKRRKRNSNEQDAECDGTFPEKNCNGHGRRKVQESDAPKKEKAKGSSCGSDEELEVRTWTDDDVELTVEDLVIIAEEYIRADGNINKEEEASNQECESDSRFPEIVSSGNELEDSADAQICNRRSLIADTTTFKPNGSLASKGIGLNSGGTGDPAQDMLDLFLGPLMKKTVEKESESRFLTEDVTFAHEIIRESHSNVVREGIAPIMKKKSSLKDKVAMFLD